MVDDSEEPKSSKKEILMDDREISALISAVTHVAKQFNGTQQIRQRIRAVVMSHLKLERPQRDGACRVCGAPPSAVSEDVYYVSEYTGQAHNSSHCPECKVVSFGAR